MPVLPLLGVKYGYEEATQDYFVDFKATALVRWEYALIQILCDFATSTHL